MSRFDSSDEKLKWWRRFLSRLDESYDDKRELKTKLKFIKTVILYQTIIKNTFVVIITIIFENILNTVFIDVEWFSEVLTDLKLVLDATHDYLL